MSQDDNRRLIRQILVIFAIGTLIAIALIARFVLQMLGTATGFKFPY